MDSKVKYGQEHGPNLIKICKKLAANQNLCKLLVNTDLDPLNPITHPDNIDGISLINKNIRIVPLVDSTEQNTQSKIVILFDSGNIGNYNSDDETIDLLVTVLCPFKEWLIAGDSLRPYAIMSEIRKSLQDKRINGLGEIIYKGFDLASLSDEMGSYLLRFSIHAFS